VIFADRGLVAHYASPARARLKLAGFAACALVTGILLAGWIWSYSNNRELTARVQADLEQAARLQEGRAGLAARLEALELLQARIEQLERYRQDRPLMLAFGLYQGEHLERKLCEEYFGGMRDVLVTPAGTALESALADANAHAAELTPASAGESYNALKAYLMLGDVGHLDPGHLGDQLTRYWRGWLEANRGDMRHEQLVAGAERLLTFFLAHSADPAWPRLEPNLILVDATRENLRRVVRGASARERVFADIVGRTSTRYPAVTVAGLVGEGGPLVGSRAVAGAFTKQAWDGYVEGAIREAASKTLRSTDWVLRTSTNDDLSLEGSPDQIRAALTDMYKAAYVREWSAFLQGVSVAPMASLDAAVRALDRLADSQSSPLALVLKAAHAQTAWDGPDGGNAALGRTRRGLWQWFREAVLRRAPSPLQPELADVPVPGQAGGRIAREFSVLGALFAQREKDPAPLLGYLDLLARLRARLQQLKNNGDPGPGARQLMQQTLDGSGSELSEALKLVDERMLAGGTEGQKQALRPLLVRPLQQTFGAIVQPVEAEINKVWMAQVVEPFRRSLAAKYPFDPAAGAEAGGAEIGQVFGPDGAVARFVGTTLGPLVVRRGDVLAPRQWGDVGIAFTPEVLSAFPSWLAPLSANGVSAGTAQTVFQLLPAVAPGVQEYTIEVDGQQLRYRNTAPAWASMVHPGSGIPGARISAVTMEGRAVELFNEPGDFGLKRMIDAAARRKKDNGVFELRWSAGSVTVAVDLRVASSPDSAGDAGRRGFVGMKLPDVVALRPPGPATLAAAGGAQ
ncbi:MAG TPA: ImcF-related family protein, partial [Telluria sp.]|nr:ImcF-related family protein [Telluria sp.]